jgi:D-alanyl-D-alanine carboxypeptidase (penicillin-binding protein 5/6)
MKVLMKTSSHRNRRRRLRRIVTTFCVVIIIVLYCAVAIILPTPVIKPTTTLTAQKAPLSHLSWPTEGEAAVGIYGTSILVTHGKQAVLPTASTAKLLTALSVLHKDPMSVDQQGPTITLSANDVALYNAYAAKSGSVVAVASGEQISEYEMLEAMMLPSANNMADSLAIWAFGSLPAYESYANQYATKLGLTHTHVGSDASGFDPSTTSTTSDLVRLGELALANPVLAQIVSQKTATGIPGVGTITNVNQVLGTDHIVGIKTGNSNQAGGVFISASKILINQRPTTVVTAIMNAPNLYDALYTSLPLITSAQANFSNVPIAGNGTVVGAYKLPWGGTIRAVASQSLASETWNGVSITADVSLQPVKPNTATGHIVGTVTAQKTPFSSSRTAAVILQQPIPKAPIWWRLIHPEGLLSNE